MLFHNVYTKKCILYPDLQEIHRYENRKKKVRKEGKEIHLRPRGKVLRNSK